MDHQDILLHKYCKANSSELPEYYEQIEKSTHLNTVQPWMSSDEMQGRLLALLSHLIRPKLIVEVGTFTAYATAFLAEGLYENGRIISIEKNKDLKPLIEKHIAMAGLENKVDVHFGNGLDRLEEITEVIDLIFIDAGKREYTTYYNTIIEKVRSGGLIIADNTLWKGRVLNPDYDKVTKTLHEYNQYVKSDPRIETLLLPYRDGVTIMRKK